MGRVAEPAAALVEQHLQGARQRPSLIVLRASFTTADKGAAYAMAKTLHHRDATRSYHYFVDEATIIKGVDPKWVALSVWKLKGAIEIMVADDPSSSFNRWEESSHKDLLVTLSELVAQLCAHHNIPPRLLMGQELLKWEKWHLKRRGGIITDGALGSATWPQARFMELVHAHISKL